MSEQSAGSDRSARPGPSDQTTLVRSYLDALRAADVAGAYKVAAEALRKQMSLAALYQRVITPAMHEVGRLWEEGALTVADERLATRVTNRVLSAIRPPQLSGRLRAESGGPLALLAVVQGEQHALGLRMAADLLEDGGYRAAYLGADVPTDALLQAIRTLSPELLALSATMPDSTRRLEEAVEAVRGERPGIPLVIGGQGSRSPRLEGETVVEDLELLAERVPPP